MSEMIRVAVDAMGGDNGAAEMVKGAVEAVNIHKNVVVVLVGLKETIEAELAKYDGYDKARVEIVNATENIDCHEAPVAAIKKKKDSSIVVALNLVKSGQADCAVSAGSSGALFAGAITIVGRIKGVERTPFAPLIPTLNGVSLIVDSGANVDAKPSQLVQYARMGSIYAEKIVGIKNPRVGIVNVGAEEEKGNALVKETFPLLKECKDINFIGSVEARDIPYGVCDVIVCDAFVGNVILKLYEGTAGAMMKIVKKSIMSNLRSKIGGMLLKPALKKNMNALTSGEYGGAPFLGLNGLVVKIHGSSSAADMRIAIGQCINFKEQNITELIRENITASAAENK
ncbi:MAG: phosphate acyltransferase PlsX [Lachnospiraceae bacterium]